MPTQPIPSIVKLTLIMSLLTSSQIIFLGSHRFGFVDIVAPAGGGGGARGRAARGGGGGGGRGLGGLGGFGRMGRAARADLVVGRRLRLDGPRGRVVGPARWNERLKSVETLHDKLRELIQRLLQQDLAALYAVKACKLTDGHILILFMTPM